jgi:hypothetical protein
VSSVPEHVAAYAAGLFTCEPEASWDTVARLVEQFGLGRYSSDDLCAGANLWASRNGTSMSALTMKIQAAKREGGR